MLYRPAFDGVIAGWTHNFIHKNHWRVQVVCPTREDALQEAHLVFLKCKERYCDTGMVQCRPHFMSLYKTLITNRFNDLSVKDSQIRSIEHQWSNVEEEEPEVPDIIGESENAGFLGVMIRQAPTEVRLVLNLLLNAPNELLEIATKGHTGNDKRLSHRLARLLGLPPTSDPLQATKAYLRESGYR